tara:strand:+ start:3771 stop:4295 length:525 start_codon:yes stop_codon:yes gene_type:complete
MSKKIIYSLILLLFIFSFLVLFKSLNKVNIYIPENIFEKKLTNFETKDLFSNRIVNVYDNLSNKDFTVLNIWSSWCLPCRVEHPYLMKLKKNENLNMIGLNYKDKYENAINFLNNYKNPYSLILVDLDGVISIELGAYGVPETFIINNKKKIIIKKFIGPINDDKIEEILSIIK